MEIRLNREIEKLPLTEKKVNQLIYIKKFIDRFSTAMYLQQKDIDEIINKYGVAPDIKTWGDYFQVEIATEHHQKTDESFETIIQTVVYDIIISMLIFKNKNKYFFQETLYNLNLTLEKQPSLWTEKDEENYHLGVLYNYYTEMKLDPEKITKEDLAFFQQFDQKSNVS